MSAYEDDVEPLAESSSRGGTPVPSSSTSLGKRGRDERSPEPDEDLDTSQGQHQIWLVKVPKFLMDSWSSVKQDDLRLGTVRVYDPDHTGKQRMELLLPEPPNPPIPGLQNAPPSGGSSSASGSQDIKPGTGSMEIPRLYDLKLTSMTDDTRARNLYAFRERVEGATGLNSDSGLGADEEGDDVGKGKGKAGEGSAPPSKGRRLTALSGTITNEASLQPQVRSTSVGRAGVSDDYRALMKKRQMEAAKPKRSVMMLDETDAGANNMLASGVGGGFGKSRFSAFIQPKPKAAQTEKFARMPKNELLDLLFSLFERYAYWNMKGLRAETQQPEAYLRETLSGIADLHKRGPYNGNWSLKDTYKSMRMEEEQQQQQQQQGSGQQGGAAGEREGDGDDAGDDDDDNDDDEDEEDFEEVL